MYSSMGRSMMVESGSSSSSSDPLLAPGFRFYPTEEELLTFYLRHHLAGTRPDVQHFIPVVDIYSYHPSQLRAMAGAANVGDREQWFFFCPRAERELHGGRPARTTPSGYWKATGSPSYVYSAPPNRVIGEKRTMVFYQGRAPTGSKTRWKMNEYKAVVADAAEHDHDHHDAPHAAAASGAPPAVRLRNEFSVCRVYVSNGTLRSFDRRPLNLPGGAGAGLDQAAAVVHYQQQQQQQRHAVLPPQPLPPAAHQMPAANTVVDTASHDSSSSAGSRGADVVVDGAEDAATAIDWDSLVAPVDDLRFSVDDGDDLRRVIWPRPGRN